ncbi:hypothetical protein EYC84_005328 [Monilinia fructicola]|uniref:Uncharacterized protein n=1 Tax=Monilinia fructicola TaxID=38448 RepID=A0A5M9K0V0_MONFR|nr:hypothetical protein EYC84_005328 [Monilinia fructicola]
MLHLHRGKEPQLGRGWRLGWSFCSCRIRAGGRLAKIVFWQWVTHKRSGKIRHDWGLGFYWVQEIPACLWLWVQNWVYIVQWGSWAVRKHNIYNADYTLHFATLRIDAKPREERRGEGRRGEKEREERERERERELFGIFSNAVVKK